MTLREDIEDLARGAEAVPPTNLTNYGSLTRLLRNLLESNPEPEPEYEYGVYAEGINYRVHPCHDEETAKTRVKHYQAVPRMYGVVKLMRRAKPHTWEEAPQ